MHTIDTARFGAVEIDEKKILTFENGLAGLEDYKRFAVLQYDESFPIVWLQSTEDSDICLPVVDPFIPVPSYVFDIEDEDVAALRLTSPDELQVLAVVVIPEKIESMTANLAAPVIINQRTCAAKQVILHRDEYNVRFPILEAICRRLGEERL